MSKPDMPATTNSLNFIRNAGQRDIPNAGVIYLHHFGTGHQELVFASHERAAAWAKLENCYLNNGQAQRA